MRTTCPTTPRYPPRGDLLNDDYDYSTSTVYYDSEANAFYLHAVMERDLDVARPG